MKWIALVLPIVVVLAAEEEEDPEITGSIRLYGANTSHIVGAINFLQTGPHMESFIALGHIWDVPPGRYIGVLYRPEAVNEMHPCDSLGRVVKFKDRHIKASRPVTVFIARLNSRIGHWFISVDEGGSMQKGDRNNIMNRIIAVYKIKPSDAGVCFVGRIKEATPVACGVVIPDSINPGDVRIPDIIPDSGTGFSSLPSKPGTASPTPTAKPSTGSPASTPKSIHVSLPSTVVPPTILSSPDADSMKVLPISKSEPLIQAPLTTAKPPTSTAKSSTVASHSTAKPSTVSPTSTAKPSTVASNSTAKPTTVSPTSTAKPSTVASNSTAKPTTVSPTSTAKPSTVASDLTAKPSTVSPNSTAKPSTVSPTSTAKPSTVASDLTAKPSTVSPNSTAKPSTVASNSTAKSSTVSSTPTTEKGDVPPILIEEKCDDLIFPTEEPNVGVSSKEGKSLVDRPVTTANIQNIRLRINLNYTAIFQDNC